MSITVTHTYADGTLVDGTQRGDGSADVLKPLGLRWSRNLGMWYVRNSRDKPARLAEPIAEALRAAGFSVELDIDDTPTSIEDREAARAGRADARQAALSSKADRLDQRADASRARADAIIAPIPPGQPILVGHHSERRHRRALDRHDNAMWATIADSRAADDARRRADASARETARRESFPAIGRRIDRLEAEEREHARRLAGATGEYAERAQADADETARQLDYWRARRDELIASGEARDWQPSDFQRGDRVMDGSHPCTVVRVNRKTLTVQADVMPKGITTTTRYYEITAHHRPEETT